MARNDVELVKTIIKEKTNKIKNDSNIDAANRAFGMIDALRLTHLISREEFESLVAEVNDAIESVE